MTEPTLANGNVNWRALSKEQWREQLTDEEFRVLRKEDTERSGSSPLNQEKRAGTFVCAGCKLPLFKSETKFESLSYGMIIGGAFGNLIDRFRFGGVADFLDVYVGTYHWPSFNIADACITIGVVLLLIQGIFMSKKD